MVDLPEADRPVNQTVAPCCLRSSLRSLRVRPACQVMLLFFASQWLGGFERLDWNFYSRRHVEGLV